MVLAVEDEGPGVPEHLQQQIFEPFFTTRSNGTGLGLAVVQAVANSHNGIARCLNGRSGGARFELTLPVYLADPGTVFRSALPIEEPCNAEA